MTLSVVPQPVRVMELQGRFVLDAQTVIVTTKVLMPVAHYLQKLLSPATGFDLLVVGDGHTHGKAIVLSLAPERNDLGAEGYVLQVSPEMVEISSSAAAGAFYGVQTLRQLSPVEIEGEAVAEDVEWTVPCVEIEDYPRFAWRGYMLDVGRHFHDVETVKRTLDLMALHKLNRFHWHLTDDQGWRIEIKKYPRLTEIGSKRRATSVGGLLGRREDGVPHGGYYTQDEIREVVAYATEQFITVVPEIEMPGHSLAALAAYPELSCTGGPFEVSTRFGIRSDIYCAGKDAVYTFLEDVLDEVMDLFPSEVIHIGGDEAPKRRWKKCPDCQARMQREGIEDAHGLQTYLTNRMARYLADHGRRLMGWNEMLNDGLDAGAICQYWMGKMDRTLEHARQGRDVVMSHWRDTYLDRPYGFSPLSRAYAFDPIPEKLEAAHYDRILGLEAPMWCEFVPNVQRLDWQTWPRLAAYAETGWTPREGKDFDSFKARLEGLLARLDVLGVEYALLEDTEPKGWLQRLFAPFTVLREQTGGR